jgi:hypothetical protein
MFIRRSCKKGSGIPALRSPWTIYSHLMPNMQAEAAAKVDAALKAVDKNAS